MASRHVQTLLACYLPSSCPPLNSRSSSLSQELRSHALCWSTRLGCQVRPKPKLLLAVREGAGFTTHAPTMLEKVRIEPRLGEVRLILKLAGPVREGAAVATCAGSRCEELAQPGLLVHLQVFHLLALRMPSFHLPDHFGAWRLHEVPCAVLYLLMLEFCFKSMVD